MEDFQMYSKIQQEKKQGFSKDATARHLGLNWRTVDQYWEMTAEDYAAMQKRQYNSGLDKRREIVLQWLKGFEDSTFASDPANAHLFNYFQGSRKMYQILSICAYVISAIIN